MDGTILQTAGLIVLGWFGLAIVVGAGVAAFLCAAHQRERQVPTDARGIREWVRASRRVAARRRRRSHHAA